MGGTGDTTPLAELLDERQQLIDVARWMLGVGPTAEEAVTEAYRRWYGLTDDERTGISDPRVWLTERTGTICLARLCAPARRLPGPGEVDAGVGIVADFVGRTPRECAEPAESARRGLRADRACPTPSHQHDGIVRAVRQACVRNDARQLVSLLSRHAIAFFDGGGKIRALTRPVHGDQRVARTLLTLLAPRPRTVLHLQAANGRTAIVVRHHDRVAAVISFDITDQRVTHVWAVLNPDKLHGWNRPHPPADGHGTVRHV